MKPEALLSEVWRRFGPGLESQAKAQETIAGVLSTCFDKQVDFIRSQARYKAAFCTRRAGKTTALAAYKVVSALERPNALVTFVAKTRARSLELTGFENPDKPVETLCQKFDVPLAPGAQPNRSTATLTLANGSVIRWRGADDMEALYNKRGDKGWLVLIDEAQDFPSSILHELVDNIFGPSLEDLQGTLCLSGTPGLSPVGYWHDVTTGAQQGWRVFSWSVLDNPHMAHMKERLPQMKLEKGWADDNATYRREWLGQWVSDTDLLFYRFDPLRNLHEEKPEGPGWSHVLGWDLGSRDDMAVVVWGFHQHRQQLYEAFSWKKPGALVDECARVIQDCKERFNIIAMVADTGGGGKMFVEETSKRHGLKFEAAKKPDKAMFVRLFNDDMALRRILLRKGSPLADELAVLPVDKEYQVQNPDRPPREHPGFANHCADAGLYAWRRAYHYLHEPEASKPTPGTPAHYKAQEEEMLRRLEEEHEARESAEWWERE